MPARVIVSDLRVTYPLQQEPALDGVSFTLQPGESLLVVGTSGSGKSTLALALAGLVPGAVEGALTGSVQVDEVELTQLKPGEACRYAGIVFQDPETQFCMLTVEDEVAFGLENAGVPLPEFDRRITEALDAVGLADMAKTRIDRLSGGQKQRLAIATMLALRPPVLILDEPTANLDPAGARSLFALLQTLIERREQTVILIEHQLEIAASLTDRVLYLAAGRQKAFGPPREVFDRWGGLFLTEGVWQPFASEVASRLRQSGYAFPSPPLSTKALAGMVARDASQKAAVRACIESLRRRPEGQAQGKAPKYGAVSSGLQDGPHTVPSAGTKPPAAIEFKDVYFAYPNPAGPHPVLTGFNWQVPAGQIHGLVGPNGAGKSTLARLCLGLLLPDAGAVLLHGQQIDRHTLRRLAGKTGMVFQNPEHQFITDSVWDEIAFSFRAAGQSPDEARHEIEELLREFKLADRAHANPFSLSQGEKRRLSVATMLATRKQLLILDEPTFGQDQRNAAHIMNVIARRRDEGCTVIVITHDMRLLWEYADGVTVLVAGDILFQGAVDELFARDDVLKAARLVLPPPVTVLRDLSQKEKAVNASCSATMSGIPRCTG